MELIIIKLNTNSYSLNGVINKLGRFLDHISSKKVIVKPNCPLNKTSHNITADKIILRTPMKGVELFSIRKLLKKTPEKNLNGRPIKYT